jgi:hypothetical protein
MTDEAREEGFYWVVLGQNPPEIAYWERGEWWLAGDARPWQPEIDPGGLTLSCSGSLKEEVTHRTPPDRRVSPPGLLTNSMGWYLAKRYD